MMLSFDSFCWGRFGFQMLELKDRTIEDCKGGIPSLSASLQLLGCFHPVFHQEKPQTTSSCPSQHVFVH